MGLRPLYIVLHIQLGDRFYTSESDVSRRQISENKVGLRVERAEYCFDILPPPPALNKCCINVYCLMAHTLD